jgi:hypothetical protein
MQAVKAINHKHQRSINRALQAWFRYSYLNDQRDIADGNGDSKSYKLYDRACEKTFDRFMDFFQMLPKREQINFEKSLNK